MSATASVVVVTVLCDSGARQSLGRFCEDEAVVKLGSTFSADVTNGITLQNQRERKGYEKIEGMVGCRSWGEECS